jgi:hypothetical protein
MSASSRELNLHVVQLGFDLGIQLLERGVWRNDSCLEYHDAFEDAGQTAASF